MPSQLTEEKKRPNYIFGVCCFVVFLITTIFYIKLVTNGSCAAYHWERDMQAMQGISSIGWLAILGLEYLSCLSIKRAVQKLYESQYLPAVIFCLGAVLLLGPIVIVLFVESMIFGIC